MSTNYERVEHEVDAGLIVELIGEQKSGKRFINGAGRAENPSLSFRPIPGAHHLRPPNTGNPEETERAAIASGNLEEA